MSEEVQIRLVNVEFLRPGPPHNQLLSPLTQYLAVCGDAGAGVVTVPYEHGRFERLVKELRYETGDPEDRLAMLHDLGMEMGRILGGVPGLPGSLTGDLNRRGTLVHLRLTLSASELALLPFELAKVPVTPSVSGESWLSIQTRPPVCVTRNIRTVSSEGVIWPDKPRILFVAGENVPHEDHSRVLEEAIRRFKYDRDKPESRTGRTQFSDLLTVLINPTLADVQRECREHGEKPYTHIHVLTHGDLIESSPGFYGLVLAGPDGAPDVVSGDRFRTAITSVCHRPTVVTLASCDSANIGAVAIPGASFAHELHQAGIPLVLAAQFPLSIEGALPLTESLYSGLLWGRHPLMLLQEVRAELHARYTASWHDWASLVVYEALPRTLADQLDSLRYSQAKRALGVALQRIDDAVGPDRTSDISFQDLEGDVEFAVERLPLDGQYAVECTGLRASSRKRLAQAAFSMKDPWRDPYDLLDESRSEYNRAVRGLLVNDWEVMQRVATLHWVLVQAVSLSMVLGKESEEGAWEAAKLSADRCCEHPDTEQRAWAHGSLAELWLVRLGEKALSPAEKEKISEKAVHHTRELGRLYPWSADFPVTSTRIQFERYVHWWGSDRFQDGLEKQGGKRLTSWNGKHGLIETARRLVELLQRRPPRARRRAASPATGSGGAGTPPDQTPPSATPGRSSAKKSAAPLLSRRRTKPFFDIEVLPAGHGDSLWIEYGNASTTHRWLIDCGTQQTARYLLPRVEAVPPSERFLELFVMSHIDSDHIGGALPFFKAVEKGLRFGDVWFNGWRHVSGQLGARQGEMFSTAIQDFELPWNLWQDGGTIVVKDGDALPEHTLPGGMKLTLLSPTPEKLKKLAPVWTRELTRYSLKPGGRVDYSKFLKGTPSTSTDVDKLADEAFGGDNGAPNGTSIAVLAEFGGASALLAADAHAPVLVESIKTLLRKRGAKRLKVDVFKVSHHASQKNVSTELVQLLDCPRYIVSTDGNHFYHPDRQAVARLIKYGGKRPALHFNYKSRYNDVWARPDLQEQYGYSASYPPDGQAGITLSLPAGRS